MKNAPMTFEKIDDIATRIQAIVKNKLDLDVDVSDILSGQVSATDIAKLFSEYWFNDRTDFHFWADKNLWLMPELAAHFCAGMQFNSRYAAIYQRNPQGGTTSLSPVVYADTNSLDLNIYTALMQLYPAFDALQVIRDEQNTHPIDLDSLFTVLYQDIEGAYGNAQDAWTTNNLPPRSIVIPTCRTKVVSAFFAKTGWKVVECNAIS